MMIVLGKLVGCLGAVQQFPYGSDQPRQVVNALLLFQTIYRNVGFLKLLHGLVANNRAYDDQVGTLFQHVLHVDVDEVADFGNVLGFRGIVAELGDAYQLVFGM